MLMRNYDSINTYRLIAFILNRNLTFCIRTQKIHYLIFTQVCSIPQNFMRIHNWSRHKFRCFIACKTKHHTLITGTLLTFKFVQAFANNSLINIRRLRMNSIQYSHRITIQPKISICIANVACNIACNFLNINISRCCNFSSNKHKSCRSKSFTSNMTFRIIL